MVNPRMEEAKHPYRQTQGSASVGTNGASYSMDALAHARTNGEGAKPGASGLERRWLDEE